MTPGLLHRRGPWYSAAPSSVATPTHVPSRASHNRFNDGAGAFSLRYLAADPVTALLEAAALHGAYATGFVPALPPARAWTVFRYQIAKPVDVVDFAVPTIRALAPTSVQELTGDLLGYLHRRILAASPLPHLPRVQGAAAGAPTQRLANRIHSTTAAHGLLTPSVKAPTIANLVLFFDRLPPGSILHTGTATLVL